MKRTEYVCQCQVIHGDAVERARAGMPENMKLFALADFYKAFADNTRVRILYALDQGELCVCDLAALLEMSVSAVSHQLRFLRDTDLVRCRREGKTVFYSLADNHVRSIIECGMEHISERGEGYEL